MVKLRCGDYAKLQHIVEVVTGEAVVAAGR